MPNPRLTPGAVVPGVTAAQVCAPGYASSVRDVPEDEAQQVYAEYGAADTSGRYEVDHLIPLELGGSNAITNLWPQPRAGAYGADAKDDVENWLHDQVCRGRIALADAQAGVAAHWWTYLPAAQNASSSAASVVPPTSGALTAPVPSSVQIVAPPGPVRPGATETLAAMTAPSASCTLSVTLPSGAASQSSGLGAAVADASGTVRWSWKIGTRTTPGTAVATVTCPSASASASFTIG